MLEISGISNKVKIVTAVFIAFLGLYITPVLADKSISEQKLALIKTLLQQTHQSTNDVSEQLTDSYIKQISTLLKQSHPKISSETLQYINDEVSIGVEKQLTENQAFLKRVAPLYDESFTLEELETIIEFNQTPFGKKLLTLTPIINKQYKDIYEELSLDLAPDINARVLDIINESTK